VADARAALTIVNVIATKEGLSLREVETLLNTRSELLGISGLTNDMRILTEELGQHEDRRVRLAIEWFCWRAKKYVDAYLASMAGAAAIVFTGGIGENSAEIRANLLRLWLGRSDAECGSERWSGREALVCTEDSRLRAYVIPTDEELLIAGDTVQVVLGEPHPS
jgi:acetate kinase